MQKLHHSLHISSKLYRRWHQHPRLQHYHWVGVMGVSLFSFIFIFSAYLQTVSSLDVFSSLVFETVSAQTPCTIVVSNNSELQQANQNVQPGDVVCLRGGTYNTQIRPARSGEPNNYITYMSYPGEEAVFTDFTSNIDVVNLNDRNYIIIDGLKIMYSIGSWVRMRNSHHNIIRNNYMKGAGNWAGVDMNYNSNYHKILNNTFIATCSCTEPCNFYPDGPANLGPTDGPADSVYLRHGARYNLIEGNYFGNATHQAVGIVGIDAASDEAEYNIVRNNIFENRWHSNLATVRQSKRNLVEYNIVLDAGEDASLNYCGSKRDREDFLREQHGGIGGSAMNSIYRFNISINNGVGFDFNSWNNYFYNNTSYNNYNGSSANNKTARYGNVFKNNIFAENRIREIHYIITGTPNDNYFFRNIIFNGSEGVEVKYYPDGNRTISYMEKNYPNLFQNNLTVDPKFVDPASRDLRLQPISPAIDAGDFLTKTVSAGSGITMKVEDANYFTDGWGIIEGDVIQLEGQTQRARIIKIDYQTNTLTLDKPLSWTKGQGVSLAYEGSAPDIGAYEYGADSAPSGSKPPSPVCGNNICETDKGENVDNCKADCGGYSANTPPTAFLSAVPSSGTIPLEVKFNASLSIADFDNPSSDKPCSATDPNLNVDCIKDYIWDFGDGNTTTTQSPTITYTYKAANTYTASVVVVDKFGAKDKATVTVTAQAKTPAPACKGGQSGQGGPQTPDIDSNGCVDEGDLSNMLSCWNKTATNAPSKCFVGGN